MSLIPHLLIVDDSDGVREVLSDMLVEAGYRVSCAVSGAGMRAVIDREAIDLVVLDAILPDEPSRQLARYAACRQVRVLMISAHPEEVRRLNEEGIFCLAKPFRIGEFIGAVESVLADRAPTRPISPRSGRD